MRDKLRPAVVAMGTVDSIQGVVVLENRKLYSYQTLIMTTISLIIPSATVMIYHLAQQLQ